MFALIAGVGLYSQKYLQENRPEPLFPASGTQAPPPPAAPSAPSQATGNAAPAAPVIVPPMPAARPAPAPKLERAQPAIEKAKAAPDQSRTVAPDAQQRPQEDLDRLRPAAEAPAAAPAGDAAGIGEREADKALAAPGGAGLTPSEEKKEAAPAKMLQAAPPAAQPAPPAAAKDAAVEGFAADKETKTRAGRAKQGETSARERRIADAKLKMAAGNYSGALQDLLQAQQTGSNSEIERLIEMCRDRLKPAAAEQQ
jgi:hypothetical protein